MSKLLVVLLVLVGCSRAFDKSSPETSRSRSDPAASAIVRQPQRIDAEHLPNPVQLNDKVISGGLPDGDRAFAELRSLGVKTIISVDGMTPDVTTANKYGLRYVHLPHGYDGVPENRVQELAKAVRELEGPIYIHCHHGKHRSPAAASVACVAAGLLPVSQSVAVLELAGTSPNYRGLYESARNVRPLEEALLNALKVEFRETAEVPAMAEAMVAMGHTHEHLKQIATAGWKSPPNHPDLSPAHEALLMREQFTELLRTDEVQQEPEEFRALLEESEKAARELEDALRAWTVAAATDRSGEKLDNRRGNPSHAEPLEHAREAFATLSTNCKSCHQRFRDVPLSEKHE